MSDPNSGTLTTKSLMTRLSSVPNAAASHRVVAVMTTSKVEMNEG